MNTSLLQISHEDMKEMQQQIKDLQLIVAKLMTEIGALKMNMDNKIDSTYSP